MPTEMASYTGEYYVLFQDVIGRIEVPFGCLFAAPESPQTITLSVTHAARISHLRARHAACRGRPDRPRSLLPRDHARLAATRAAQRGAARDVDRGGNPCRKRAGRRLAVAHALDRFAAFRIAGGLLLFSIASEMVFGVRTGRQSQQAEQAVEERLRNIAAFPLAIPLMAGPGVITATILLASPSEGDTHAACDFARRYRDCSSALLCCLCTRGANRQAARRHRQYRRFTTARSSARGARCAIRRRRRARRTDRLILVYAAARG